MTDAKETFSKEDLTAKLFINKIQIGRLTKVNFLYGGT